MFKYAVRHIIDNSIEDLKIYQKKEPKKITLSKSMHDRLVEEIGQETNYPVSGLATYLGYPIEIDYTAASKIRVE